MNNFDKKTLRDIFLSKRLALSKKFIAQTSRNITDKILSVGKIADSQLFSIYLPIKNEVETKLIIDSLNLRDAKILVPAYSTKIKDYVFSKFGNWQSLEKGPRGILQPRIIEPVDPSLVDVAILPGLAFSKRGVRLGYGKGVFDRLFSNSKAIRIGLAYDFQIGDKIPQEEHDLVMDIIITEKRVLRS
ncbi:MAG: hypothetical protein UU19_C0007G0002 [Candidatus Curtissbacteria bacterium GW2011_GWD1_40_8]|nr:MAG: hypothetical protein UU19_C0007G0002 [Candidatus Curtissbacteria bacterium GW2011_GWD1_40_8]